MSTVAVVGAGHGGLAVAGLLASRGHAVRLADSNPAAVDPVAQAGSIELLGKMPGQGKLALATTDVGSAVRDAPLVMVVVPGDAHLAVAEAIAPHVAATQMIVLHPGGAGGALEFAATFKRLGLRPPPTIAEIESFSFGSKIVGPGRVQINTVKGENRVAALPARDTGAVLAALTPDFPRFVAAPSVLATSFNHMNAMLHVPTMLMSAGWIESTKGDFEFYRDGVSPSVARVMEDLDLERMAVADALGAGASPLRRWIKDTYGAEGATLFDTIQTLNATVYKSSRAPGTLKSRYLSEDVPSGLVPIAALGQAAGVATPLMRSLIDLVSRVHGVDHWRTGRTLERMGLGGLDAAGIRRAAAEGLP